MQFATLANQRHSVRSFTSRKVEKSTIEQIIEVARKAPSAVNFQPFTVYAILEVENLEKIKKSYHRSWMNLASVVIVVVSNRDMAWKRSIDMKNYADIDAAIFIDHLTLQAADIGLGTCWVCNFDVDVVNEILGLKPNQEPIALIPIGYPESDEIPAKKRKGLDELVVWM
jgi:nitroreductase